MDITAAIANIQDKWLALDGIRSAPDEPTDLPPPFPCVQTFEVLGAVQTDESLAWGPQTGTIRSELHIQRTDLARAVRALMPFRAKFLRAVLNDPNLGGTVLIVNSITWTLGPGQWAEVDTVAYTFDLAVTLELDPA